MRDMMNRTFIRWIIFMMEFDLALEYNRLDHIRQAIAHDEATLLKWKMRLLELT